MKNRWKNQASIGTEWHAVLQKCFTNPNMSKQQLIQSIQLNQYLTPDIVEALVQYSFDLRQELERKYGTGLIYYPEFAITNDANTQKKTTLFGIIDLLVIDSKGNSHIIDYKTSIHSYADFNEAKKLSYSYQLAVYQRMLQRNGLRVNDSDMFIAPIQIEGFRKDGDNYAFDKCSISNTLMPITQPRSMWSNIEEFLPEDFKISIESQNVTQTIADVMGHWLPNYSSDLRVSKEQVIKRLKKQGKLEKDENGHYTYTRYKQEPIIEDNETDFIDAVYKYESEQPAFRLKETSRIKSLINEAIKNGLDNVVWPSVKLSDNKGQITWIKDNLSKYCDGNWEIVDNTTSENFGILLFKTKKGVYPKQVDAIRISTYHLEENYRDYLPNNTPHKSRRGLTGNFEPDIVQQSKPYSLMAEATYGNIESLETMIVLNQLSGLEGYTLGNIQVVNPRLGNGTKLSNEQLLYCYRELNKFYKVQNDKFLTEQIKMADKYSLVYLELSHILSAGEANKWKDDYKIFKGLKSSKPLIDGAVDGTAEDKINALQKLLVTLIKTEKGVSNSQVSKFDKTYTNSRDLNSKDIKLYNDILIAIAQLKGINYKQQLDSHKQWLETGNFIKGVSGLYTDNPGNLDSETLNLATKLVTEAYQNVRDDVMRQKTELFNLVEQLRKEGSTTLGNQTDLYSNMFETVDGDFLFKDPNRLQGIEKKFLEYVLDKINKNRFQGYTDEELQKMKDNHDIRYFRVPLTLGGIDSVASAEGLVNLFKKKCANLSPKHIIKNIKNQFNELQEENNDASETLFVMSNNFDRGENDEIRKNMLAEGSSKYEHNLELLTLKHIFAYSVKDNMDLVFPMIKSSMIHLCNEGSLRNTVYDMDIKYLDEYIKSKIFNQSIITKQYQKLNKSLGILKKSASLLTLAFAPVQVLYQPLQGLWTDIRLIIQKPGNKNVFTFRNFKESLAVVYGDLLHFSDSPTVCSSLNELYGINDMDMNTYSERISHSKKGVWNIENFAFKFASRPDYYNRMTIFVSHMKGDGCWEAHSMVDGELVYDWKKDKRFSKFSANPHLVTNDAEYNKQKALYYAMAKQFVAENAKMPKGKPFVLDMSNPMPLPRAYTNKEAESIKSLSDDCYGYYSHEKKSLIMSTIIGGMWLQFKTYWSGKKNQYLQPGGVRLRGSWEHYYELETDENGNQNKIYYYYQVDSNGNILFDKPCLSEKEMIERGIPTIAPFMQWTGRWQEGIISTLNKLSTAYFEDGAKHAWDSVWFNNDERLRNVYRSNIKQFGYDMFMFALSGAIISVVIGALLKDIDKQSKKAKSFYEAATLTASAVVLRSFKNSFLDFNVFESIGGPVAQWSPFALEFAGNQLSNIYKVAIGDEDIWDGVINTSGGLRQIKPVLNYLKPDMFKTVREGGTFGA